MDYLMHVPGLATALTPIVHGEPPEQNARKSNFSALRRISYYVRGRDRDIVGLPVVSGNAVRGMTRRRFIGRTMEILEAYNLDQHVAYWLLAGGATDRESASIGGPEFRKELRQNLPFMDLLGGSLRGCFLAGRLRVGFMIPATQETAEADRDLAELIPAEEKKLLPTIWELNQAISNRPVRLTRYDDGPAAGGEDEAGRESGRMIYAAEAFPANTLFGHYFNLLGDGNELVENALWAFVECWLSRGEVGGWHAKGFGRVEARYWLEGEPLTRAWIKERADRYWKWLEDNKAKVRAYLEELGPRTGRMAKEAADRKARAKAKEAGTEPA
jgi:hypothetical protein